MEARIPPTLKAYVIVDLYYEPLKPNSECHAFLVDEWRGSGKPFVAHEDLTWATQMCRERNRELARKCSEVFLTLAS